MEKIFKYGFLILLAAVIFLLMIRGRTDSDKLYIKSLEDQVVILNQDNKDLELANELIVVRNKQMIDSLIVLEAEIVEIEYKKILLTKYYEKRIRNIDKLSVVELDSAFASRYGR